MPKNRLKFSEKNRVKIAKKLLKITEKMAENLLKNSQKSRLKIAQKINEKTSKKIKNYLMHDGARFRAFIYYINFTLIY